MANIPTPRSKSQIFGAMMASLLSRLGLPSPRAGDPSVSILEAAAQSDFRASMDLFGFLSSLSLDRATGQALDRAGADDGLTRTPKTQSTGTVDITDSSFTKISSRIPYTGAAPIIGSLSLDLEDGSLFGTSGSLYIGRGTGNFEGPLTYNGVVQNPGGTWTVTLTQATTVFHNLGEEVVKAQGGIRTIGAGSQIQTPGSPSGAPTVFRTQFAARIPDGETQVLSVPVISVESGALNNLGAGSLTAFATLPFPGATVTNALPTGGATDTETDALFRERIRNYRASRSKGTPIAIKTAVQGITAPDESRPVASSNLVTTGDTTLYIDDGAGYQERSVGIPTEVLLASAIGGESYFQLSQGRPVARAAVESGLQAPFIITPDTVLTIKVGGISTSHRFVSTDFRNPATASAYEIVASICADPDINWTARVSDSGTRVTVTPALDDGTEIQVEAGDVATVLGLPVTESRNLWLYKDDVLLNEAGKVAALSSRNWSTWTAVSAPATLTLLVDGVSVSVSVADTDFWSHGYPTVASTNNLDAWTAVLSAKIPGVDVTNNGANLVLTSRSGARDTASIQLVSGTLMTAFWTDYLATGRASDYSLDRNLGQVKLSQVLTAGQRLTAGTEADGPFIETSSFTSLTVASGSTANSGQSGAEAWILTDGAPDEIPLYLSPGVALTATAIAATAAGNVLASYTAPVGQTPFRDLLPGDWLIAYDGAFSSSNRYPVQVQEILSSGQIVRFIKPPGWTGATFTLTAGGIKAWRASTTPQRIYVQAGTKVTPGSLADLVRTQVRGCAVSVYRTSRVRLTADQDIAVLGANPAAQTLGFVPGTIGLQSQTNAAVLSSQHTGIGTPSFALDFVTAVTPPGTITYTGSGVTSESMVVGVTPNTDGAITTAGDLPGNRGHVSLVRVRTTGPSVITTDDTLQDWLKSDGFYAAAPYVFSARDSLAIATDIGDFTPNLYLAANPTSGTYGGTNTFTASGASPALRFGTTFNWADFAVHMKARVLAKGLLWRYYRHGPEGQQARLTYEYPSTPSYAGGLTCTARAGSTVDIQAILPSGAAVAQTAIRSTTYIGVTQVASGSLYQNFLVARLATSAIVRSAGNVVTVTLTLPASITDHGLQAGVSVYLNSTDVNFPSGLKLITTRSATQFTYNEAGAAVTAASQGTVSMDFSGEAGWTGVTGDIWSPQASSGLPAAYQVPFKGTLTGASHVVGLVRYAGPATAGILTWYPVGSSTGVQVFPFTTSSFTLATAVGTSGAAVPTKMTDTAITLATYEDLGTPTSSYPLTDGINWVRSWTVGAGPGYALSLVFKDGVTPGLATGTDWANEEVRLVPTTTQNLVDWLASPATGGLSTAVSVETGVDGRGVRMVSLTPGSGGSVAVTAGSGNRTSAQIRGSGLVAGTTAVAAVRTSDADGFRGQSWVRIDNAVSSPVSVIGPTTTLVSWASSGLVTLGTTPAWTVQKHGSVSCYVERHGDFVCYRPSSQASFTASVTGPNNILEGDWVNVSGSGSAYNQGWFRVVRTDATTKAFWVENPDAVYEGPVTLTLWFLAADSIVPGSVVRVGTSAWGSGQEGDWRVVSIDLTNSATFTVDVSSQVPTGSGAVAAGTYWPLIQVLTPAPVTLFKNLVSVSPYDSTQSDLKFDTTARYQDINATYGSVVTAIDKPDFGAEVRGQDGYRRNTGLIAEANRVLYGDESAPGTYPGVAAADAKIAISGPRFRRITAALSVRADSDLVLARVRSAVAGYVNALGVGVAVPISGIVRAAMSVNGVTAVTILSPTYGAGSDTISVQPYEKPFVIDPETDIRVSMTGV